MWAVPVVQSSAAWASHTTNCNECNGVTLYSKYAPGNSRTEGNQCLSPQQPVTVISAAALSACGLITVADAKNVEKRDAFVEFSSQVRLIRTAIKTTSDCFITKCQYNSNPAAGSFTLVHHDTPSNNPPPNGEPELAVVCGNGVSQNGCLQPATSPPLFTFYTNPGTTLCGTANSATGPQGCETFVTRVDYDTNGVGQPINFIEILLCFTGGSVLPPECTT